jgi:hypothetical protein
MAIQVAEGLATDQMPQPALEALARVMRPSAHRSGGGKGQDR